MRPRPNRLTRSDRCFWELGPTFFMFTPGRGLHGSWKWTFGRATGFQVPCGPLPGCISPFLGPFSHPHPTPPKGTEQVRRGPVKTTTITTQKKEQKASVRPCLSSSNISLDRLRSISPDNWLKGKVARLAPFGAFVTVTTPDGDATADGFLDQKLTVGRLVMSHCPGTPPARGKAFWAGSQRWWCFCQSSMLLGL